MAGQNIVFFILWAEFEDHFPFPRPITILVARKKKIHKTNESRAFGLRDDNAQSENHLVINSTVDFPFRNYSSRNKAWRKLAVVHC